MNQYRQLRETLEKIVKDINTHLEQKSWSAQQLANGMEFVVHNDWLPLSGTLVRKYRSAGWIVKLTAKVEPGHRQYVLNIRHPEHP